MNRICSLVFLIGALIQNVLAWDNPPLSHVWKAIYAQEQEIEKVGNTTNQLSAQRQRIAAVSMKSLSATPTNQLDEAVGKLSAAMYFIGENGNMSDIPQLLQFAEIQLPPAWAGAGDVPVVIGLPVPNSDSEKRRVPACYALAKILYRNQDRITNLVADSATNKTLSATATLRILGVLIDADSIMASGYAEQIRSRFKSKQVNEAIADLETRKMRYWNIVLSE